MDKVHTLRGRETRTMQISEVEETLGIGREAVRYYISKGLLDPGRDKYSYRMYTEDDVRQLKRILVLRDLDFSVQEIREILDGEEQFSSSVLETRKGAIEKQLEDSRRALDICNDLLATKAGSDFEPDPYFRKRF